MRMKGQAGYTLVEMLVAISMSTLLVLVVANFATSGLVSVNQDYNQTLVLTNAKEAVSVVARQIRFAKSVLPNNDVDDAHAPNPSDPKSWSGAAGVGSALILAVPAKNTAGEVLYRDGVHNYTYNDNVIIYLDAPTQKLYKRVLAHPVSGNAAVTTCPPTLATPSCPADANVVDDVASLTTAYISSTGASTTTPGATDAVKYTVTETRVINGKSYSGTYSTIATLRNR